MQPLILINRFMLNLRQLGNTNATNQGVGGFSQFSAPNFRVNSSLFGNMGEQLDYGPTEQTQEVQNSDLDSDNRVSKPYVFNLQLNAESMLRSLRRRTALMYKHSACIIPRDLCV